MSVQCSRDNCFWYWFGFIYADGSVDSKGRLGITLQKSDFDHLKEFQSKFGGTITHKTAKCQAGVFEAVRLYLSKEASKIFVDAGIKQNKTYISEDILIKVPDEYKSDFLRGYFDGDGCISAKSKSSQYVFGLVSKNKNILIEISQLISEKLGISPPKISIDSGSYRLRIGGNKNLEKIRDLLYNTNCTDFLSRKREVFDRVKSHEFKGYCLHKSSGKWRITVNPFVGKTFKTENEAKEFIRRNHERIACKVAAS